MCHQLVHLGQEHATSLFVDRVKETFEFLNYQMLVACKKNAGGTYFNFFLHRREHR